jgi:hypothetical protein
VLRNTNYCKYFKVKIPTYSYSLSLLISMPYIDSSIWASSPWFVVTYVKKIYSKIVVGESHYSVGKKYCRRCERYFITKKLFCKCCGMQLRGTPSESKYKEKVRNIQNRKTMRGMVGKLNWANLSLPAFLAAILSYFRTFKVYSIIQMDTTPRTVYKIKIVCFNMWNVLFWVRARLWFDYLLQIFECH